MSTSAPSHPENTRNERFPRSKELPSQSPLFWVEQKDRYLRQLLIRDIEDHSGRRLVVYFANRFENAQIDSRDCTFATELFGDVGAEPVDLLLETVGGATDATESLITVIRGLTKDLRVIVANAAKSNGTLLGLAAKSIIMGAPSELGPIEPLVNNIPCSILLSEGMMFGRPPAEIDEVVQKLSSRDVYFSHGSAIDHKEAVGLGLTIEYLPPDDPLWQRIWLLYCMYEHDCRIARYLKIFEGRVRSTAVAAPPRPIPQTTPSP